MKYFNPIPSLIPKSKLIVLLLPMLPLFAFNLSAAEKHEKIPQQKVVTFSTETDKDKPAQIPEWSGKRPPVDGDWVQTLNEDFNGTSLDATLWTRRQPYDIPIHNQLQRYLEENVIVENGIVSIKCEKKEGHQYNDPKLGSREYTTGVLTSYGKWTQAYGYIEARVKTPLAKGLWACFWTMPDRGVGSNEKVRTSTHNGAMEVDIQEQLTNWGPGRYNLGMHWDGYKEDHKYSTSNKNYYGPTSDGWHTFGLLWEPGKYTFYCDGIKKAEWANERVGSVPSFIILDVNMRGASTREEIEIAKFPDYYQIDYVKAWQLKSRLASPEGFK